MFPIIVGVDVHKRVLAVVVRVVRADGAVEYVKRKFGTTLQELQMHLVAFLQSHKVTVVVMESTAQYWRPVWYGLEPHFKLHLCHPLRVQARRGNGIFEMRNACRTGGTVATWKTASFREPSNGHGGG